MEWLGWEGHLETIQLHPPLWAGVLQLCWCLRSWLAVPGYSLGHGVPGVLGRRSHVMPCCAPSPASDLHEPVPEPGPTELQRLEAALHQTPSSVQVSPDWLQGGPVLTYRTFGTPKFLLGAPDQACVLLLPSLLLNHLLESWESSSKKVGESCGMGWKSVPVLL